MEGTHKNLIVWKESILLVKQVYQFCASFPSYETYALSDQIRRSSTSIPSNIAEGYGRGTDNEILHFLHIALGSANELDTQLILALELGYISKDLYDDAETRISSIIRMLRSLINKRKENGETPKH